MSMAFRTSHFLREVRLPSSAKLFLISLIVPLSLHAGALRLSPYRLVLMAMLIPCLLSWASGRSGSKLIADWCVLGICAWSSLSLGVHHGVLAAIEGGGVGFIETAGAWFLARATIRTPEAFFAMARLLFIIVLVMLPFALIETATGRNVISELLGKPRWNIGQRLGLYRVRGPFDHPILYGVFCGAILGLTYFVLGHGKGAGRRLGRTVLVLFAAGFSLSSGPLTAITSQIGLIAWDKAFQRLRFRWHMLAIAAIVAYAAIDLLSSRSPIKVFLHYFSFSSHTAYNRLLIWEFGKQNILANPLFGIGLNDWARPSWMSDSVDMFWILPAMQNGVVVWIFYFTLFFSVVIAVGRRPALDRRASAYRTGFLVTMTGLFIAGWAVHFWNATFVFFIFLLGSGAWIIDARPPLKVLPPPSDKQTSRTLL